MDEVVARARETDPFITAEHVSQLHRNGHLQVSCRRTGAEICPDCTTGLVNLRDDGPHDYCLNCNKRHPQPGGGKLFLAGDQVRRLASNHTVWSQDLATLYELRTVWLQDRDALISPYLREVFPATKSAWGLPEDFAPETQVVAYAEVCPDHTVTTLGIMRRRAWVLYPEDPLEEWPVNGVDPKTVAAIFHASRMPGTRYSGPEPCPWARFTIGVRKLLGGFQGSCVEGGLRF